MELKRRIALLKTQIEGWFWRERCRIKRKKTKKEQGTKTIGYCTIPGIRDKFSDHTCLFGELKWPKPRANVGFIDV